MTSVHSIPYAAGSEVVTATFQNPWTPTSILYCSDCHGNSAVVAGQARGPHTSGSSPILVGTLEGVQSTDADLLCYDCHLGTVYATGAADGSGMSWFVKGDGAGGWITLHSAHVKTPSSGGQGISCGACHVSHGSVEPHLLRTDIGFAPTGDHAGSCDDACHAGARVWPAP
jgi:predicted CXXCH cytochrome family protein